MLSARVARGRVHEVILTSFAVGFQRTDRRLRRRVYRGDELAGEAVADGADLLAEVHELAFGGGHFFELGVEVFGFHGAGFEVVCFGVGGGGFEVHAGVGEEAVEAGLHGLGAGAFDLAHDFGDFGRVVDDEDGLALVLALVEGDDLRADADEDERLVFGEGVACEDFDDAFAVAGFGAGDKFFGEGFADENQSQHHREGGGDFQHAGDALREEGGGGFFVGRVFRGGGRRGRRRGWPGLFDGEGGTA